MRRRPCLLLGLLLATICLVAPTLPLAPAPPVAQEPMVLRVTTRLVQVNVIVQDRKGRPVANLSRGDFVLLEEGQEQSISIFSVESGLAVQRPTRELPPNTFSNRQERYVGVPRSVTVILLDGLNTPFHDQVYARQHVVKFLQQIRPQDRVALYALGPGLSVLHDFTSDARPLLAAMKRYKSRELRELRASHREEPQLRESDAPPGAGAMIAWMRGINQRAADFHTTDRVLRTLYSLEAIAHHLSRFPGRKNLIWVTASIPFSIAAFSSDAKMEEVREQRTFFPEVTRVARAFNNANLALYPVDARGLMGLSQFYPGFSAAAQTSSEAGYFDTDPRPDTIATMQDLAERTGGRAFFNTNDIQGAIRRAMEDSRVTYVLGYYSPATTWDGSFRRIEVKVKRRGLRTRHRRGYFALADPVLNEDQRAAVLRDATWGPLEATGLGLTVRVERAAAGGSETLALEVRIDPRDLAVGRRDGKWVGAVDYLLVQRSGDGQILATGFYTLGMAMTSEEYDRVTREGLILNQGLSIAPGAAQLRVIVRDLASGALGSVDVPLDQFLSQGG